MFQKPNYSESESQINAQHTKQHDDVETVVGPSVHVEGDFSSEGNIFVKGNVKVDDRLELTSTAQVLWDIECGVLVIEAGALIRGKVTMKGLEIDDPKSDKKSGLIRGIVKDDDKKD